ncbi:MAG: tetratricopeptide repeat protein [Myxococcota bacterium]
MRGGRAVATASFMVAGAVGVSCAHAPQGRVEVPPVDHLIEVPVADVVRLEPAGLTHLLRGLYFLHNGHPGAAVPHLRLALMYDGDSAFIHERLSRAWGSTGRADRARQSLDAGLRNEPHDPWLNLLAGKLALDERRFEAAVSHLGHALTVEETVTRAGPRLVEALLWLGRVDDAERSAADLMARKLADADLARGLATTLEEHGRLEAALTAYRQARTQRPADRAAAFGEMRLLVFLGRDGDAADALVPLFGFYPDEPELYVQIMRLMRRAGRPDAEAYREEALRQTAGDAIGRTMVAAGDLSAGRQEEGLALLVKTVEESPTAINARLYLAEVLLNSGDPLACVRVLSVEAARDVRFHRPRSWCLAAVGRFDQAVDEIEAAVVRERRPREMALEAVRLLTRYVPEQRARESLKRILAATSDRLSEVDQWVVTAVLVDELGHGSEATILLERAAAQRPDDTDVTFRLADVHARHGKLPLAVEALEKLMRERPHDPRRLNAFGFTLADAGVRLDEAEVWLRRAYRLAPDDGYIIDSLGWVMFEQGEIEAALEILLAAGRASPGDAEILRHIGDAYRALGQRDAARAAYEKALASRPSPILRSLLQQRLANKENT